jgi:hypothetical protein
MVTYQTESGDVEWQEEYDWIPPMVGNGVIGEDDRRWRIVDVWIVQAKHGLLEYGVHAIIAPATGDGDLPNRIYPGYYR